MNRWVFSILGVGMGIGVVCAPGAEAHLRDYIFNQQYYTAKPGELEVELYNDADFVDTDNSDTFKSVHQIELEYGLTNHWQITAYEVLKWEWDASEFKHDEWKLETKYRFAEAGQWPVDTALYLEYAGVNGHHEQHSDELEGKLILSRDFGPWNLIGNLITEKALNKSKAWEFAYTVGTSYAILPTARLGLELKETLGDGDEFGLRRTDHKLQLVPGLYMSLTKHLRLLVGAAFGLTKASDDLQLRSIVEWEF